MIIDYGRRNCQYMYKIIYNKKTLKISLALKITFDNVKD